MEAGGYWLFIFVESEAPARDLVAARNFALAPWPRRPVDVRRFAL
jgi:hypothetical protein